MSAPPAVEALSDIGLSGDRYVEGKNRRGPEKDPANAIAFNRTLSPAANVGVKSGRRGYFSS